MQPVRAPVRPPVRAPVCQRGIATMLDLLCLSFHPYFTPTIFCENSQHSVWKGMSLLTSGLDSGIVLSITKTMMSRCDDSDHNASECIVWIVKQVSYFLSVLSCTDVFGWVQMCTVETLNKNKMNSNQSTRFQEFHTALWLVLICSRSVGWTIVGCVNIPSRPSRHTRPTRPTWFDAGFLLSRLLSWVYLLTYLMNLFCVGQNNKPGSVFSVCRAARCN